LRAVTNVLTVAIVASLVRLIHGAPTRAAAEAAIDVFAGKYDPKYEKAVACLTKDREALLVLFDFPAEHWDHLRTSDGMDKQFFCMTSKARGNLPQIHSFVRPRRRHSSAPTAHLAAAAHRACQGWPHFAATKGLALIGPSTAACSIGSGLGRPRCLTAPSVLWRHWN
jgi:hypothetical protein